MAAWGEKMTEWVWIFHGEDSDVCSAVFETKINAENWIQRYALNGILTRMPLNKSVYDWAIDCSFFSPIREYQKSNSFVQKFTSAYLKHYHYKNGENQE